MRVQDWRTIGQAAVAAIGFAIGLPSGARPASGTEFEVASVKPVRRQAEPLLSLRPGRLNLTASLRQIIGVAYSVQRFRVQGGPGWLDSEVYDIAAKAEDPAASRDRIREMLQTLLAERFKLTVHRVTKEIGVYALMVGENGPRLREAKAEEKSETIQSVAAMGLQTTFRKMPIAGGLVNYLANVLGGPVMDKTGLTGFYDFKLEWSDSRGGSATVEALDAAPDLFRALQLQLGLRLERAKGLGEILVVDRAERASEN